MVLELQHSARVNSLTAPGQVLFLSLPVLPWCSPTSCLSAEGQKGCVQAEGLNPLIAVSYMLLCRCPWSWAGCSPQSSVQQPLPSSLQQSRCHASQQPRNRGPCPPWSVEWATRDASHIHCVIPRTTKWHFRHLAEQSEKRDKSAALWGGRVQDDGAGGDLINPDRLRPIGQDIWDPIPAGQGLSNRMEFVHQSLWENRADSQSEFDQKQVDTRIMALQSCWTLVVKRPRKSFNPFTWKPLMISWYAFCWRSDLLVSMTSSRGRQSHSHSD